MNRLLQGVLRKPRNAVRIQHCTPFSTKLDRRGEESTTNSKLDGSLGFPKVMAASKLRHHLFEHKQQQGGSLGDNKLSSVTSKELRVILHQVGNLLNRSKDASADKELAMSLLDRHVLAPARSHGLKPEILTLGLQILEEAGEYDKAMDLYYHQKDKGATDVQHLTSLLRVMRTAVGKHASAHKKQWNNQSMKHLDSKQAMDGINKRDAEILSLLAQALDVYKEAVMDEQIDSSSTSSPFLSSSNTNSHIVANAILGVLMQAPKDVIGSKPELLEEAIAVMLNLHRTENDLAEEEEGADNNNNNGNGSESVGYSLPVEPHRGVYGQLITLAGRAGTLPIVLQLHDNMVSEAELYPTIFTETCLLSALGDCGEYEMAHNLYDDIERTAADPEDGPGFGTIGVRTVTKYMELCLASGNVGRGLLAFKNWRKQAPEWPTWYCYEVLHSLAIAQQQPGGPRAARRKGFEYKQGQQQGQGQGQQRVVTAVVDEKDDGSSDKGDHDGNAAGAWNAPGQWSAQRVAKEQSEALKIVTKAVDEGLRKPYLHGEVPLSLLGSEVGCHLLATGKIDLMVKNRLHDGADPEVARCWSKLAYLLRVRGSWRDLVSVLQRLMHGHEDVDPGTKMQVFGYAAGAVNALSAKKGEQEALSRVTHLWDSHLPSLLAACWQQQQQQLQRGGGNNNPQYPHPGGNNKGGRPIPFRFHQFFRALKGDGGGDGGSALVPQALQSVLESRPTAVRMHPRLLTDALHNCSAAEEAALCLEVYATHVAEGAGPTLTRRGVAAAIADIKGVAGLEEEELLAQAVQLKLFGK
jgi:hypothetical protein